MKLTGSKIFLGIFALVILVSGTTGILAGCMKPAGADSSQENTSADGTKKTEIRIAALKGPTSIGMVKLMETAENGEALNNYKFTVAGTADEFTAALIKGDIQIAALPCNLAATLYNRSGGKIRILGINTLGVLYILENGNSVKSVSDLRGKTIIATGLGTTPEYTFNYLLKKAGLVPGRDVKIEYRSEATEAAALLAQTDNAIAMLPQPYVTTVMMQDSNIRIAVDVTKEWEKLSNDGSTVVTGVLVVNSAYAWENPDAVERFIKEYKASVDFVNSDFEAASLLVEKFGIFKAEIAKKSIPLCNITYINGIEMKLKINAYLKVLYEQNPDSVGGALPGNDFYR